MGRSDATKKTLFGGKYEPNGSCCIRGCGRDIWGHEFCRSHYQAWRDHGHPLHMQARRVAQSEAKTGTKEYKAWWSARARCTSPRSRQFVNYGARGIKMCDRWLDNFEAFLKDMGKAPSRHHSIEREDVNGNYEPGNCRWATVTEQNRNQRTTRLSVEIVAEAKRRHRAGEAVYAIAKELGVPNITLWQAVRGKSWKEVEAASG